MNGIIEMIQQHFGPERPMGDILEEKVNLEDETFLDLMKRVLFHAHGTLMPFNSFLGIEIVSLNLEEAIITFPMRPELVGNYEQKILHGGVISAAIDLTGGIAVQFNGLANLQGAPLREMAANFVKMSTINMRVDYLRPGAGDLFRVESRVARRGNKVSVISSDMFNDRGDHIALGTASYMVG